jgi:hypothetical protein
VEGKVENDKAVSFRENIKEKVNKLSNFNIRHRICAIIFYLLDEVRGGGTSGKIRKC